MIVRFRMWIASATLAAVISLATLSGPSYAVGDKDIGATVKKIAEAIKKGDNDGAKKMAAAAAKNLDEIADLMHLFRPRNKGGLGIGPKAGTNPAKDGIEVKLRDLGRDVPAGVAKEAEALEATGYYVAALSEVAAAKGWPRDSGKKTKKAWNDYSGEMKNLGVAFAKAAAGKGAQEIKTAAAKLNENCNRCHSIFKE